MECKSMVSNGTIGAAIKRRRNKLSWSLEKLGDMINVTAQQIQRYESGLNTISAEKLQQIAHALSMPVCRFFHDDASQNMAFQNDCYGFDKNWPEDEREVPALQLGNYVKNNPILLIDDDARALDITKLFLEFEGYRNLHLIQDSRNVMAFLEKNNMSLVLLDIRMPHVTGNDLLRTMKNDHPALPVIVMTAKRDSATKEECMKLGALDYLVKPVPPEALMSAVQNAMKN